MKNENNSIPDEIKTFNAGNFQAVCNQLAAIDPDLKIILEKYGFPPMWTRNNTFESLLHIILEQQVSLASALATLNKLKERLQDIRPDNILLLNDEEMKTCYVSRQKAVYIRGLAQAILSGSIVLQDFETMTDEAIRGQLIQLKGIGHWTIDVYLMFVLQRSDFFPIGDVALVNALKHLKNLDKSILKENLLVLAEKWKPNRSVASMMLWHYYLSKPKKQ